jgi:hypothetical protein
MKEDKPDISVWLKYAEGDLHLAQWGMQDKNPVYHPIPIPIGTAYITL